MFLGGFSTNFHDRLYRATLLDGGTLAEGPWQVDHDARGRTAALVVDPPRAAWDGTGMHTTSYVPPADGRAARIYYTGRSTRRHYGPGSHTRSASWSSETVTGIDGTTRFSKEGLLAPACWNPSSFTPRVATAYGTRPTPMRSARASYPTTSCAAPTAPTGSPTGHRHGCSPAPRRASSTTRSSAPASGGSWSWPASRTCTPPATSLTRACGAAMHPPPARIGRTGRHRGACWTPTTPGRRRGWPAAPTAPPWPSPTHGRRKRRSSSRAPARLRPGPGWRYSTSPGCGSHRCPPRSSSPQVRSRSTSPPVSVTDPHPPGT